MSPSAAFHDACDKIIRISTDIFLQARSKFWQGFTYTKMARLLAARPEQGDAHAP
jgi:hypothetical protein